jgi:hypothetical protein
MMRAQRDFVKNEMVYLHRKMREQLTKDSTVLAKVMQEVHDKREVEPRQLRTENKKAAIDQVLLLSDFQLFKRKNAAPSGAEELAQCQRDLRGGQIRSLLKDDEIQALELHIHMLKGLMHAHDIALPPETSESAPAFAPPAENVPTWGNSNAPPVVDLHNNGWGTNTSPSPAPTQESYHGFSDESMEPPTYGKYGKNSYHKGFKGKGHKGSGSKTRHTPHSQGKRGRDSYEDDKRDREVRQKTWNADGKTTAENWSKSLLIRTYMRNLTLEKAQTLLDTLKQADIDFQHKTKSVPIENWHETIDDNLLHLHKALGMPINLTVSPHFYYQAAQWPCNNAINMLANTELLDKSHGSAKWLDLFQQGLTATTSSIPVNISQLGDQIRDDYRIAKHYLELQAQVTQPYQLRRHHFYLVAIIRNDKRPTRTFTDKNTHIQMKRNYHLNKNKEANLFFNRLFDAAFKNHFNNIMQEIERFATYNTPLEYTLNFTADIRNLYYYYTDNCTGVREER